MNKLLSTSMSVGLKRTKQGTQALMAGLKRSEPERLVFLAVGETAAWSRLFNWTRAEKILSPAVTPSLALSLIRLPKTRATGYLAAALAAGSVGQWAKSRDLRNPSALGVVGVSGHYAEYASALCHAGARPTQTMLIAGGAAVAAGTIAAAKFSPAHVPAVLVGGTFAALNAALADDPSFRDDFAPIQAKGISHGANLLLGSEAMTFVRALTTPGSWAYRGLGAAEAAAHYLGSFLLFEGLSRR